MCVQRFLIYVYHFLVMDDFGAHAKYSDVFVKQSSEHRPSESTGIWKMEMRILKLISNVLSLCL